MKLYYDPNSPSYKDVESLGHEIKRVENYDDLSEGQRAIVEYFDGKTQGKRLSRRSDLNPMDMPRYLPNIVLFDLAYDEQGVVVDVTVRVLGTGITEFYGDWTGKSVTSPEFQQAYPESSMRLLKEINHILYTKESITSVTKQFSKARPYVNVNTLKIPFSGNGTDIDMILMFFELI